MFTFEEPENFHNKSVNIVLGDFNSDSITWGYSSTDSIGDLLENWAEGKDLKLLHDPNYLPLSIADDGDVDTIPTSYLPATQYQVDVQNA